MLRTFFTLTALSCGIVAAAFHAHAAGATKPFSPEDAAYWFYQPLTQPAPPADQAHPIDAFIQARLNRHNIQQAPPADKRTLIRRATLDLHGLPPTPQQITEFLSDDSPDAYAKLIDRLLESPRYGERYARHWLDIVRYADTDGFKSDVLRPDMYHYRDYVIRSLNADKPYDRFLQEQLAGDELFPHSDEAAAATGYLRLWPYEDNQPDVRRQWKAILEDVTDITGEAILGLGLKCAKCHDHKYDPIRQADYYNLQAFFAPMVPREDLRLVEHVRMDQYQKQLNDWQLATVKLRDEMGQLKEQPFKNQWATHRKKFPGYIHEMLDKPDDQRTPLERQFVHFAEHQINYRSEKGFMGSMKADAKKRWNELEKQIEKLPVQRPAELPKILGVTDVGPVAPPTYVGGGESGVEAQPAYLAILDPQPADIRPIPGNPNTTGRRAALARWITDPQNQISTRVIVNRLWQWHFGDGIVTTSNDFGRQGEKPTHPELLDYLVNRFTEDGWSLKDMHRLIMTSETYRQSSVVDASPAAQTHDPENKLLWRMRVRRMDAEQIRDTILTVAGNLDTQMGGPAVSDARPRRSIYTLNKRNKLDNMLNTFDTPDLHNSCARRDVTTTPIQALALINGNWTLQQASAFAESIRKQTDDADLQIQLAYRSAFGRAAIPKEITAARAFLDASPVSTGDPQQPLVDLCHVLLNANEFVYVD
ncbi:MAG: DUF1549 and DUF1553 domain-containing protein [Planctomycetota bacterium]|jgi:hypothetical protein